MDVERLQKLAGSVRMGGKGTMRRCARRRNPTRATLARRTRDFPLPSALPPSRRPAPSRPPRDDIRALTTSPPPTSILILPPVRPRFSQEEEGGAQDDVHGRQAPSKHPEAPRRERYPGDRRGPGEHRREHVRRVRAVADEEASGSPPGHHKPARAGQPRQPEEDRGAVPSRRGRGRRAGPRRELRGREQVKSESRRREEVNGWGCFGGARTKKTRSDT
eukprot:30493-Pelagococcus_subviridis.AAC.3